MALHPNFDTRDDCSKRVQLGGANQVQRMRLLPIGFPGKNRRMHPHRVQLLQAEVSVHPHRVQMHPVLVHFGDYDGASYIGSQVLLSPHERCVVFRVDLPNLLHAVNIGLVDCLNSSATPVVTTGAEFTVDAAGAPQRLMDDADALLPGGVLDQYGFHGSFLPHTSGLFKHPLHPQVRDDPRHHRHHQ